MAGGYTLLSETADRDRDKKCNGGAAESEKEPLRVPDDLSLTPELTCDAPLPPRDLISVFVVTFDPKEGNLLEWTVPSGVSLDGIEFRALISGAHTITSDFIYFRQGDFYGAACYKKMELSSEIERGVRMKSVGVIVAHYYQLQPHLTHLAKLVRYVLRHPGSYETLQEYFESRRAPSPPPTSWHAPPRVTNGSSPAPITPATPATPSSPPLQVLTASACQGTDESPSQLLQALGDQLVYLWRASLLCKRILLFSEPPIGRKCGWVHWLSLLGAHTTPGLPSSLLRPLYYVSLADLDLLADQHAYVACTTEKIFEEKTGIYDLYIEGHKVRITKKLPAVTTITPEDRLRISALVSQPNLTSADLHAFFRELNDGIFSALYRASSVGGNGLIGADELATVGLNGHDDCVFLRELAATHGFDVTVRGSGGCLCCPCVL